VPETGEQQTDEASQPPASKSLRKEDGEFLDQFFQKGCCQSSVEGTQPALQSSELDLLTDGQAEELILLHNLRSGGGGIPKESLQCNSQQVGKITQAACDGKDFTPVSRKGSQSKHQNSSIAVIEVPRAGARGGTIKQSRKIERGKSYIPVNSPKKPQKSQKATALAQQRPMSPPTPTNQAGRMACSEGRQDREKSSRNQPTAGNGDSLTFCDYPNLPTEIEELICCPITQVCLQKPIIHFVWRERRYRMDDAALRCAKEHPERRRKKREKTERQTGKKQTERQKRKKTDRQTERQTENK
jgi:hypothetical protein